MHLRGAVTKAVSEKFGKEEGKRRGKGEISKN